MEIRQERYYIYKHTRLDTNEVFYIGRGKRTKRYDNSKTLGKRYTRAYNKTHRTNHWKRIISCSNYKVDIVFHTDDFLELKSKEKELIKLYGRKDLGKGELVNYTDGGDGIEGYVWNEEQKIKQRERNINRIKEFGVPENCKKTFFKEGIIPSNSMKVKNKITGVVYPSITEAARQEGLNPRMLRKKIQGKRKNNTDIIKYEL